MEVAREYAACANCGDPVTSSEWHPAAAPEGVPGVYAFCDAACRAAWLARVPEGARSDR